jgi:stage V sporulation protein SpoVS
MMRSKLSAAAAYLCCLYKLSAFSTSGDCFCAAVCAEADKEQTVTQVKIIAVLRYFLNIVGIDLLNLPEPKTPL